MIYIIILSVIAGTLGLYYLFIRQNHFKKHDIPHLNSLLQGNMSSVILRITTLAEFAKKIYDIHPEAKYIGMYDIAKPIIMLRDPELIKSIALKNFDMFMDHRGFISEEQDPLFGKNLFSLRGDTWREVRAMLSPSFTSSKMKHMFKLMSEYATEFTQFVAELPSEQKVIETKDIFTRYTNDVIATCAFGISVDSMRDPKNLFYMYGKEISNFNSSFFLKVYIFKTFPRLAHILNLKVIAEKLTKFFNELVETTVKTRDEKGIVRPDMLQLMMENRHNKDGRKELSMEDMTSQAFIFFLAGFDGTATLMSFAAHEIAVNENVHKRLQNEIDQVLGDTNGQVTYEAVNNMEYLEAVVSESLRKYPISVILDRLCLKDFELPPTLPDAKPYILKEGDEIWIPVYGLHHDPKYFKQPEKFDPERFLGEKKKQVINSGAYMPFGLGPRICIGNRFALLETKVLLFHLLARCDLLPCEKTPMPLKFAKSGFAMKPEGGFWLKVVPRQNSHRTVAVNASVTRVL